MGFFKNTLCAILLAAGLAGCSPKVEKEIYVGKLDGNKVILYEKESAIFSYPNYRKVITFDNNGNVSKVLYDAYGNGFNDAHDYVETYHSDGKNTRYTVNRYIDKNGKVFFFDNEEQLGRSFSEKGKEEFKEANVLYQRVLNAVIEAKSK